MVLLTMLILGLKISYSADYNQLPKWFLASQKCLRDLKNIKEVYLIKHPPIGKRGIIKAKITLWNGKSFYLTKKCLFSP